jgi:hypothetical protein
MNARVLAVCAVVLIAALGSSEAAAQQAYQFLNIADTSGAFSIIERDVAINDSGTVAFKAVLDAGGLGIFTGSGGPTTPIVDTSGMFASFYGPVDINNSGRVAFTARLDNVPEEGVFSSDGGPVTTIATVSGVGGASVDNASINSSGVVAFRRILSPPFMPEVRGVYASDGVSATTITEAGFLASFTRGTSINDSGTVAFSSVGAVYAGSGGPLTTIALKSGQFDVFFGETRAINNDGTVAFVASLDTGGVGVFTGNGGPVATVADDSGPFAAFGLDAPINDSGDVAFLATLDGSDAFGIYTGGDPMTDQVIREGDSLFGSTLVQLTRGLDLNDDGAIAFSYLLANGVSGVAVARVVPEPSAAALLVAASLGCVARQYTCRTPSDFGELGRVADLGVTGFWLRHAERACY